jgi:uncharacterized membrane protein
MNPIDKYLNQLRNAMSDADPALVQDAIYDANEHLNIAMDELKKENPKLPKKEVQSIVVEKYGSPSEIAAAYLDEEIHDNPPEIPKKPTSFLRSFFGVVIDPATWGAALYLVLSLATGIFYFTWVVTGASLSIGFMALIIGIPFLGLFVASVKGIALFEGMIVQLLLRERMPSKPIIDVKRKGIIDQFKGWLSDRHTWTAMGFMFLMLPIGIIYFTLFITFISVSLSLIAAPIVYFVFNQQIIHAPHIEQYIQPWNYWLLPLFGIIFFVLTLHLTKAIGRFQALFAKAMLVKG